MKEITENTHRALVRGFAFSLMLMFFVIPIFRKVIVGEFHPIGASVIWATSCVLLGIFYWSSYTKQLELAAVLSLSIGLIAWTVLIYISGGLQGPFHAVGLIFPFIAMLTCSRGFSLAILAFVVAVYAVMLSLALAQFQFPLLNVQLNQRILMINIIFAITLCAVAWITTYYAHSTFKMTQLIKHYADIDFLTQLPNRGVIRTYLDNEFNRAKRQQHWLHLMMIDADKFKQINDTYGHQMGDECLKEIAQVLEKEITHYSAKVGRYGGEEFLLVLTELSPERCFHLAKKIREHISKVHIDVDDKNSIQITATIGICSEKIGIDHGLEKMLKTADECMYLGKGEGRNSVVQHIADGPRVERQQQIVGVRA